MSVPHDDRTMRHFELRLEPASVPHDDQAMRHFALRLEYEGTHFVGWQLQAAARTVQGELEGVLQRIFGKRIVVHGSGRTDSGVHALGQIASFKVATKITPREFQRAMDRILPEDVAVLDLWETDASFHARFSAKSKVYRYRVLNRARRSALDRAFSWHVSAPLEFEPMAEAARELVGTHDFRAFCSEPDLRKSTVRTVSRLDLERAGDYIIATIEADGFLYNMVRAIVGTLIMVGSGKMSLETFRDVIRTRDRRLAGPTAPACGLFLLEVRYR